MVVGVCSVNFLIHDNHSLKGKRQVIKSLIQRVKNRFNISIAEVDDNDLWQRGRIGFCIAGNDRRYVNSAVDKTLDYIRGLNLVDLADYSFELINFKD